ncbi:AbrB family transcriptional regulator [Desertibacillus haloalkaliphilus]|uniref:AbrB family transcriptional regulator n=1 Tax=Desertibacillus haloalkaliphilus TaxID=1328930 RepID=UPI001C253998|nr:AbrB family transcriptional regulator [Desertibacillus haloalkaliphilus]MBU8904975.1 AbrB family transcriptional regulator [Desertibacillus haloalkaliphilus]
MKRWVTTSALALLGGTIGFFSGFPLGALLGSLLVIAAVQLKTKQLPPLPKKIKRIIQMLLGGSIGLTFNEETFAALASVWTAALLIPLLQIMIAFLLAYFLKTTLKFDPLTAICSTAPAGMTEMIVLAEKYPISVPTVVTIHLYRLLLIVTVTPFILYYFFN